jgi:threonine dehydratase
MHPEEIEAAAAVVARVAVGTPLERNERLSALTGAQVWVKREDLQPVRSYKLRGAFNLMSALPASAAAAGVVCASAGNHAQGVALACTRLGLDGVVYLPRTTPRQKRERITVLGGGRVRLAIVGDTYDDASAAAAEYAATSGATLVPAFDHPATIAGQGTVAPEIVAQLGGAPDVVVVPVGGGGLLAGCGTWFRARHPGVRLVGVEAGGAAAMAAALAAGRPVDLDELDGFADGAAVRRVGDLTYPLVRDCGADLVEVSPGALCTEMLALYQSDGIIAEPAGALATAAVATAGVITPGSRVVCLLSGGNNDVSRYADILERSLIHQGLKHYLLVEFPQEPGALRRFLDDALGPDDDITHFEYVKRNNRETGPALVGIELTRAEDLTGLLARMARLNIHTERVEPDSSLFRFLV